jgi:hypothetical protein
MASWKGGLRQLFQLAISCLETQCLAPDQCSGRSEYLKT